MPGDEFLSHDATSIEFPKDALKSAVKGTRREQLEAIRDYIATQLEADLCDRCANSRLRTGDQASLITGLRAVLADLDGLVDEKAVDRLAMVRNLRPGPNDTTEAIQRRTGSRRPGAGRPASTG